MQTPFSYFDSNSFIHRLHPVVKLGLVLLTLTVVLFPYTATTWDFAALAVWLAFTVVIWILAGIDPRRFTVLLKILLFTFTFLILIQGFMYRGGKPILTLGHIPIPGGADLGVVTDAGVFFGLLLCLRVLVAMAAVPVFVTTTSPAKIISMCRRMGIPNRFSFVFVSALTFTDQIFEMWNSILDAQKLRGFDISSMGLFDKMRRGLIPVLTPLVLLLFRRGDELEIAMEGKGFGSDRKPTEMEPLRFSGLDAVAVPVVVLVFATVVYVKFFRPF